MVKVVINEQCDYDFLDELHVFINLLTFLRKYKWSKIKYYPIIKIL
jgi:hypothetical protein